MNNIFMQLIFLNLYFFFLLFISFGYGHFFLEKFKLLKYFKLNIFGIMLVGLIFCGFFAQFLNFFFPLTDFFIYISFLLSLYIIFIKKKNYKLKKKNNIIIIFFIFILVILQIYGSDFSDDLNHYHLSSIINSDQKKYIIGSNFLHNLYGTSSIWLILHSFLNINEYNLQGIHVLNGLTFFLILSYFLFEIKEDKSFNQNLKILRIFLIFFLLLKYTRLKEFGIDRPAFIFMIFFFDILIKHTDKIFNSINKKKLYDLIILLLIIGIFIFFIKIIFFPILLFLILLFLFIKQKIKINFFYDLRIYFILFILFQYLVKNLLISGCLIYPIKFLCINYLTWYSPEILNNFLINTEIFNKSFNSYTGSLEAIEFIKNLNWVGTWAVRTRQELFDFFGLILLSLILSFFCFKFRKKNNSRKNNFFFFFIILFGYFFYFYIWFFYTPIIRMGHHIFIIFGILILLLISFFFRIKERMNFTVIFIIIFFTYNLSKNFIRISQNNYVNNPQQLIIKNGWYYKANNEKLGNFTYYSGWIGKAPLGQKLNDQVKYKKKFSYDILYKIK